MPRREPGRRITCKWCRNVLSIIDGWLFLCRTCDFTEKGGGPIFGNDTAGKK